eukprot:5150954-Pyramimonas_sp.AAC.1
MPSRRARNSDGIVEVEQGAKRPRAFPTAIPDEVNSCNLAGLTPEGPVGVPRRDFAGSGSSSSAFEPNNGTG